MTRSFPVIAVLLVLACAQVHAQSRDNAFAETYYQYAPMALDLGLAFTGVQARDGFVDRAITLGIACVTESLIVNALLKNVVREERPDGSAFNSFPSGHTGAAFVGAELVRQQYGWGWGAGAYAIAAGVGVARVCHQRHWWWDTLAGAGCGILSANIGNWLLEPAKDLFGIRTSDWGSGRKPVVQLSFVPVNCMFTTAICPSFSVIF